ncbi:MAG: DUF6722 family protein [Candidatus Cloacimonadota bacterium]|nr:DUF6722 family protein [Candidatus Cloacimonadota bacterium]
MTKETLKEIGKFLTDLSKITVGVAFLTPFVKDDNLSIIALISAFLLSISGFILINKGTKEDD